MGNVTDITNVSDAVLEVFLAVKGGEPFVDVDHLTVTEQYQLCAMLGHPRPTAWTEPQPKPSKTEKDYEKLILDEQESDPSWWG